MGKDYQVGAYYFPNYHVDPRNEFEHGPGWTEWQLVKAATPRFPGHRQPVEPEWGYLDEADPSAMEFKINQAADHGLDYWLFDWYWYDDGPFLERCLNEGYLGARNNDRVKFALMWANHDWMNLHPAKLRDPRITLYPGQVTRETFETIIQHVVGDYFSQDCYWKLDGCPYFSVYDLTKLLASFGGIAGTRAALDDFRAATKAAGHPDLHLNAVVWGQPLLPGENAPADPKRLVEELGFDSFTSYVWIHHVAMPEFPYTDYNWMRDRYFDYWDKVEQEFSLPYFPNASMGWDSSPRTIQSDCYAPTGYPFGASLGGNTPEAFRDALALLKARRDASGGPKIMNINAWNEWTEGSYLEPDTHYQMGYLEALKDVFGLAE